MIASKPPPHLAKNVSRRGENWKGHVILVFHFILLPPTIYSCIGRIKAKEILGTI
jgi:hypothetical protein